MVNPNSQICHSRYLLVHVQNPKKTSAIKLTTTSVSSIRDKNQNNSVLYSENTIQNYATITSNNDTQSCETAKKLNYSIPTISTPNHHSQRIATTSSSRLNFNTPTILLLVGKYCRFV